MKDDICKNEYCQLVARLCCNEGETVYGGCGIMMHGSYALESRQVYSLCSCVDRLENNFLIMTQQHAF